MISWFYSLPPEHQGKFAFEYEKYAERMKAYPPLSFTEWVNALGIDQVCSILHQKTQFIIELTR